MIDRELLYPGVKVRIIDDWDLLPENSQWQAPSGKMDHWLGQVMTIRKRPSAPDGWYQMVEDTEIGERGGDGWVWKANGFAEIVEERVFEPASMDDIVSFFTEV